MTAHALTPIRVALLVALVLTVCRVGGCRFFELVDLRALDYRLRERGPEPAGDRVMIVAVDDVSIAQRGRWPWSRALMARLLTRIAADEPAVIGADFVQSERSAACSIDAIGDHIDPQCRAAVGQALAHVSTEDQEFADAVRASRRAVLGYFFDFGSSASDSAAVATATLTAYPVVRTSAEGDAGALNIPRAPGITQNLPEIATAARALGYFNFLPDRDGLYRRTPMAIRFGDRIAMPLSLAMLQVLADRPASIRFSGSSVAAVEVGGRPVPVASDGQLLLNYRGPGGTFPHISAADLLAGTVPAGTFHDKIVLLGITAIGVGDVRATPFDPVFPGVEIHANALDNILRGDALLWPSWTSPWTGAAELGALWTAVLLTGLVLRYARGVQAALASVALLAAYLVASQWVFMRSGLVLSAAYPLSGIALTYLASSLHHYLVTEAEKRRTRRMLDLYLSPKVAAYISERPEVLKLGGEKRERTVLFSDIRDFTPISESLDPEALVELLNAYLGEMTGAVFAHEGMLDKYIGDAIMAVWGAPLPQEDHALRACRAALEMIHRLGPFNRDGESRGWPKLRIGVGLSTGPMVFGNMGSSRHQSLTVMGDAVNLGARLEGLSRVYRCPIIASEGTVVAAGKSLAYRELDYVQVKGKTRAVRIFEVLGLAGERQFDRLVATFAAGLAAYRRREWDEAGERFRNVLELQPNDGPAMLFLERCEAFRGRPPAPDWQAVTAFG